MALPTRSLTTSSMAAEGFVWPPIEPTSALMTDSVIFIVP